MRVTCGVRAAVRSHEAAMEDLKRCGPLLKRYLASTKRVETRGVRASVRLPFSVSSDPFHPRQIKGLTVVEDNPRLVLRDDTALESRLKSKLLLIPPFFAKKAFPSQEHIVQGSRAALERILEAIRKKDLSPLSDFMCYEFDKILPKIASTSNLSTLTSQQLSCLEVSDDDFIGLDGVIDPWNMKDHSWGLLLASPPENHEKSKRFYMAYSVDMIAILNKKNLLSKIGSRRSPSNSDDMPLPPMRILYARVQFAHFSKQDVFGFTDPFLLNFHVHSF